MYIIKGDKGWEWDVCVATFSANSFFSLCSFIVESSSGGKEVYNIPVLEFKKGPMTEQTKTGSMPKAITVNMALLGPSFTKDS